MAGSAFAGEPPAAQPAPVTLAPLTDRDFAAKVLGARKGKAVLVSFWASYCAPCLSELPALLEMKRAVQKRGGDVVFVNVDPPGDPARIQKVIATKGLPAFHSFQVTNEDPQPFIDAVDKKWMGEVPYAAVFGKDGTLKQGLSGEQTIADLKKALDAVL
jgi:thiol-disulfide isomerase/thioredoxin